MPGSRLGLLLGALLAAPTAPAPVIDNEQVRAAVISVAPRGTSPSPQGSRNRLVIYLDAGAENLTYADGRAATRTVSAGDIRWSPAGSPSGSENMGGKPFRVVQVDLKGPGRPVRFGPLDPVRLAPKSYRVLLENSQVRVLRARIGPKQSVPLHEHALSRVVVYFTDAHLRITDESGKVTEATGRAGDVRWAGAAKHSETNLAGSPFEVVVVELK